MKFNFLVLALMLAVCSVYATTNIGISANKVIDQTSIGLTAKTEQGLGENTQFEFDTQAQYANTLIRGKYHAEIILYEYLKLYQNGDYRGTLGQKIGTQSDLGIAIHLPVLAKSGLGIGIFGRSGGEFAKPTLADIAEQNGIDSDKIDPMSATLTAEPTGLNIRPGQSINLLLYTDFEYKGIDIGLKFMPQLTGEDKAHQLVASTQTAFNLGSGFKLLLGGDVRLQQYQENIQYETSGTSTITLEF